jgi:FlaG/FlaF family flagellin (archaellin)
MPPARAAVSPVVAIILLVAISVVLASAVYIVASNLVMSARPPVFVGMVHFSTNGTASVIKIAGVSTDELRWSELTAVIVVDAAVDEASTLSPAEAGTRGNLTLRDSDGRVNDGDSFVVAIQDGRTYEIDLIEILTGALVGQRAWST